MREQHFKQTLHDIAEEQVPGTVDLWPAIQAQAHTRRPRSRNQWVQRPLALAAVIVFALASLFIWAGQRDAASAEEILQQAAIVAKEPAAAGIQSYVLTRTQTVILPGGYPPSYEGETETSHSGAVIYFQAPNFRRGENPEDPSVLSVRDGTYSWLYFREYNMIHVSMADEEPEELSALYLAIAPYAIPMDRFGEVLDELMECYTPALEGNDTVAGRETWVIDLGDGRACLPPKPEGEPYVPFTIKVWIDQETHYILKTVMYRGEEQEPISTTEVTDIRFNVPLDSDLFTFTPPPGAEIQGPAKWFVEHGE
jgi:outer membrane lipoprotein-sorting protein